MSASSRSKGKKRRGKKNAYDRLKKKGRKEKRRLDGSNVRGIVSLNKYKKWGSVDGKKEFFFAVILFCTYTHRLYLLEVKEKMMGLGGECTLYTHCTPIYINLQYNC